MRRPSLALDEGRAQVWIDVRRGMHASFASGANRRREVFMRIRSSFGVVAAAALLMVGCSDEDGNGSGLNEEVETVESVARDAGNEVEQQVDEGTEEDGETNN